MSESFSEVSSRSWFSRLTGAFGAIFTGILLVLAACGALFWNEGRAVKTERALGEGAGLVVSVSSSPVDAANDGKLVHISGSARVAGAPSDPLFLSIQTPENTVRLVRNVEMFQWKQTQSSETRKKLGGGEETVTTYNYVKEWTDKRYDSSTFKVPQGHTNPQFAIPGNVATAERVSIGDFGFEGATLAGLGDRSDILADDAMLANLKARFGVDRSSSISGKYLFLGRNSATPEVGDMRISFIATTLGDASVIGKQQGSSIRSFETSNGNTVFLTGKGQVSAKQMFDNAQSANSTMTWIWRAAGLLAMLIGFRLIFSIVGVVGDVIPFVGEVFRFATGLASLALTFVLGPMIIGIAWIAYRPLVGVIILLAGFAAAFVFFWVAKSRMVAAKSQDVVEAAAPV